MKSPWVAIQRNPRSGSGPRSRILLELIEGLNRYGLRPRLFSKREHCDAKLQGLEPDDQPQCIVAAGGDGTVGDVVNRFPHLPLAVLPLGTENLLAKYLGVPRNGQFVADMIANNRQHAFDLCVAGERKFTLMAGVGFDAEVVRRVHESRGGHISHLSYAGPFWKTFRHYPFPQLQFFLDDNPEPFRATIGFLVNIPVYGFGLPIAKSADPSDGVLDLRLFSPKSGWQFVKQFLDVARGRHERRDDVQCLQAKMVRVECEEPIAMQVDGDPAGMTPMQVCIEPAAFQTIVPSTWNK